MDINIALNHIPFPLNLHLANPYAITAEEHTAPTVANPDIINEFLKNTVKETFANPFQPFI